MSMDTQTAKTSRPMYWTGIVLSALVVVFMLMDCTMKFMNLPQVIEATTKLGFPPSAILKIAFMELLITLLYLFPRTSVLGAILLTGLFGGTAASHLRAGDPLFTHVLFGVYLGVIAWGGLWLRNPRLRALIPLAHV